MGNGIKPGMTKYCVIGNIVMEHPGENGMTRYGTASFPGGRKVYISRWLWDDSVVVIGPKAFEHCSNLKSIKLSNRLEVIGLSAFLGCKSLKEIHIPSSLKRIEDWAFSYCSLDKVIYDGTLLEADRLFLYGTELNTSVLETKDAVLNFKGGRFYIDDYFFPGTEREWRENYGNHWLNRRARRIHTKDGMVLENECL